ncbi:hypothetical protein [Pseudomonas sp. ML96]|uniref:hypothetical protein n=1 Tax=Pseudomonas sp. ML96 TaxID=1523503 RepID=UPI00068FDDDC|nr:hypothetical protein [Pseudomonas sp. ML96]
MSKVKETALIGGRFKLGKAGGRAPTDFVGLVSTAQEQIEQTEIRLPDTTTPQGGTYDTFARVDRFFLTLALREINSRNLANALYADIAEVPSTAVTGEEVVLGVGQTSALALMPLEITKVAIGADEYDEDLDWRMTGAGLEVIDGSDLAADIAAALAAKTGTSAPKAGGNTGNGTMGAVTVTTAAVGLYTVSFTSSTAFSVTGPGGSVGTGTVGTPFSTGGLSFTITAGSPVFATGDGFTITVAQATEVTAEVDYTSATFDEIELLTNSGDEWYLLFEGANAVGEKGKFNAHYWRVKFSPTESRDVLGNEDFMTMTVRAEVLREDSRATSDAKSAYGKLQKQRIAG